MHYEKYLQKMSPENARGQFNRIKNAILQLDTFPHSCKSIISS